MIVLVAVTGDDAPGAGGAAVEAGAVDDAVLDRGGPHDGQVAGAALAGVVEAAEAQEGLVGAGDREEGVVGGGAGAAVDRGLGC